MTQTLTGFDPHSLPGIGSAQKGTKK